MIEFHDVYTTDGAADVLWALLVERSEENDQNVNISHRALPSREEHDEFISSKPYYVWNLISIDSRWLGYVSVTWRNDIGIVLFTTERGNGYGKLSIRKLLDEVHPLPAQKGQRPGHFVVNINPFNERSIRLFDGFGFKHCQNTYELINDI